MDVDFARPFPVATRLPCSRFPAVSYFKEFPFIKFTLFIIKRKKQQTQKVNSFPLTLQNNIRRWWQKIVALGAGKMKNAKIYIKQ